MSLGNPISLCVSMRSRAVQIACWTASVLADLLRIYGMYAVCPTMCGSKGHVLQHIFLLCLAVVRQAWVQPIGI